MRRAVGREAISGLSFIIDLHRRRFVGMEGAAEPHIFIWLEVVVVEDLGEEEFRLDFGDFHIIEVF